VAVDARNVNALNDATWAAVNEATARLARQTGESHVARALERANKQSAAERAATKERVVQARKERLAAAAAAAEAVAATDEKEEAAATRKRRDRETVALPAVMPAEIPIRTLEQHRRRDNDAALFALPQHVDRPLRPTDQVLGSVPPATAVLSYVARYKDAHPWYGRMQDKVANTPGLSLPRTPVLSRAVIETLMREPNPACPAEERPCFNLDREPTAGDQRVRCIAHRISETRLGPGRGYRLRELLRVEQMQAINAARRRAQADPTFPFADAVAAVLTPVPEVCVLCHVWFANQAAWAQRSAHEAAMRNDLTGVDADAARDLRRVHNSFMVVVDVVGEYDSNWMWTSDNMAADGMWGPFPLFHEQNYHPITLGNTGLRGFAEDSRLLFQEARNTQLPTTGCKSSADCTQSTPTAAGPLRTGTHL
jgi:hypothetical protein